MLNKKIEFTNFELHWITMTSGVYFVSSECTF